MADSAYAIGLALSGYPDVHLEIRPDGLFGGLSWTSMRSATVSSRLLDARGFEGDNVAAGAMVPTRQRPTRRPNDD